MTEQRRSARKRTNHAIQVADAISGQHIGHIGHLSTDGMLLLLTGGRLREDALFQLTFRLPNGAAAQMHQLEIGVHEQWSEPANNPGQLWAGFRIIDISQKDYDVLCDWVISQDGAIAPERLGRRL